MAEEDGGGQKSFAVASALAIVKVERGRHGGGSGALVVRRKVKPHPLAGRTGEGAPMAPPGWLWRAGYRNTDMYFYSPLGEKFRSQLQLQAYLSTIANPPPMSAFRWRVGPEEFKTEPLPGVPPENPPHFAKKACSALTEVPVANKKRKMAIKRKPLQVKLKEMPKRIRKSVQDVVHKSSGIQQGNGVSAKTAQGPEYGQGIEGKKEAPFLSFAQLLSAPTGYNVLSKNADTLQKFLVEAARLREKGESEIDELRHILLYRKCTAFQLSKYPESVLRVFYFILRNDDPPSSFGMKELINYCSTWSCKHKHYWCHLETSRIENFGSISPSSPKENVQTMWMRPLTMKDNGGEVTNTYGAHDAPNGREAEIVAHQCQEGMAKSKGASLSQSFGSVRDEDTEVPAIEGQTQSINGIPEMYSQPSCGDHLTIDQRMCSEGAIQSFSLVNEVPVAEISGMETKFHTSRGLGEGMDLENMAVKADDAYSSKETSQKNAETIPYPGQEGADMKGHCHGQLVLYGGQSLQSQLQPHRCGCSLCSNNPSFCYGCTCTLCEVFIQPKQRWTFLKCSICSHFCHIECAFKAKRAGVVKEMELDGEFLCPSCNKKSDLFSFWLDRVKDAITSLDRPMVQMYLASAILVLNGTQRQEFQSVHQSLMELHDSLLHNTPCPQLQQILHQIFETLENFSIPCEVSLSGLDIQEAEVVQVEEKVRERQKQADMDFMEWLLAEKNADTQRVKLKNAQEELKEAESNISTTAHRAKASRMYAQQAESRLQSLKRNSRLRFLTKEQLEKQNEALNMELAELNELQNKVGTLASDTHGNPNLQFPLLDDFHIQQKRVKIVEARLEHIDRISSFLA